MDEFRNESCRVILRVCPKDLPGHPRDRQNTAASLFSERILNRPFNRDIRASKYDFAHATPNFDSDEPVRRWYICDLNVTGPLPREDILSLPHAVYQMSLQRGEWVFVSRESWVVTAKSYCTMYCWGGREEQSIVAQMREGGGNGKVFQ